MENIAEGISAGKQHGPRKPDTRQNEKPKPTNQNHKIDQPKTIKTKTQTRRESFIIQNPVTLISYPLYFH